MHITAFQTLKLMNIRQFGNRAPGGVNFSLIFIPTISSRAGSRTGNYQSGYNSGYQSGYTSGYMTPNFYNQPRSGSVMSNSSEIISSIQNGTAFASNNNSLAASRDNIDKGNEPIFSIVFFLNSYVRKPTLVSLTLIFDNSRTAILSS